MLFFRTQGQVHRGRATIRAVTGDPREGAWPRASPCGVIAQQPGAVVESAGESHPKFPKTFLQRHLLCIPSITGGFAWESQLRVTGRQVRAVKRSRKNLTVLTFGVDCFVMVCHALAPTLLVLQGKLLEAEPLYKRTQEIYEKSVGLDHPNIATVLNNRASLLYEQVRAIRSRQVFWCVVRMLLCGSGTTYIYFLSNLARSPSLKYLVVVRNCPTPTPNFFLTGRMLRPNVFMSGHRATRDCTESEHPHIARSLNNRAGLLRFVPRLL